MEANHKTAAIEQLEYSPLPEDPIQYRKRWRSIRIMYFSLFLDTASFTMCIVPLWPYMKQVDPDADAGLLGWIVASFSIGMLVTAPLYGLIANRLGRSKEPMLASLFFSTLGASFYAYAEFFPSHRGYVLLAARSLSGLRAGNLAVIRSYVSAATTLKERTAAVAVLTGCQAIGLIIGPAAQAAFSPLGYPGPVHVPGMYFNMYTAPGFLGLLLTVINFLLIVFLFTDITAPESDEAPAEEEKTEEQINYFAAIACMIFAFCCNATITSYETLASPFSMHMFNWDGQTASFYTGIVLAVAGILGILAVLVLKALSNRVDDRILLLGSLIICLFTFIAPLPMGNEPLDIQHSHTINNTLHIESIFTNSSHHSNVSYVPKTGALTASRDVVPGGCPPSYKWCYTTPKVYLGQYLASVTFWVIGSTSSMVTSLAIFSKVIGSGPQGTMMGWLTSVGSLARAIGPVTVALLYQHFGPYGSFSALGGMLAGAILLTIILYRRLQPLRLISQGKTAENGNC